MLALATGLAVLIGTISAQTVIRVDVPVHGRVTFQSTNYPTYYPDNHHVRYVIRGPDGFSLQFDVEAFDIQWEFDLSLTENIAGRGLVAFGQGRGSSGARAITPVFQSVTNQVNATFKTDAYMVQLGFKIGVRSVKFDALSALRDGSLVANYTRGKLTWSDEMFLDTDWSNLLFVIDRTFHCRQMMYTTHWHIMEELMGRPHTARSAFDGKITLTCNTDGFSVSPDTPDEVEAGRLLFKTTGNLQCRRAFVDFLKFLSKL